MQLREDLRSYVLAELAQTAATGLPFNRPLFFDYPSDEKVWAIQDQYMFGRDYMVAPIYEMGARDRTVYFPAGSSWVHHFTGAKYKGGGSQSVDAPMEHFPLFKKA